MRHTPAMQSRAVGDDKRREYKAKSVYNKKDNKMEDLRVSVCTICRWGIFKNHVYVWTSIGYVHRECKDEAETKS
jgi:hypothetical protein